MAKTGEIRICNECKREKKIKAKGLCANCYQRSLYQKKKKERKAKKRKGAKKGELLKKLLPNIEKLVKDLIKENIRLQKDISEFLKERKELKKRFLSLRKELLKVCHQNRKNRDADRQMNYNWQMNYN